MSQLIEALKKAEEAKRKEAEDKSSSEGLALELEPTIPAQETESQAASPEMEQPDFEDSLELEPTLLEEPLLTQPLAEEKIQPERSVTPDINETADLTPTEEPRPEESLRKGDMRRRLTDEQELQAEEERIIQSSHRKRIYLLIFIAFILIAGFVSYYFFVTSSSGNTYSTTDVTNQSRGFLGSQETRSSRDALLNQRLNQNPTVSSEVQVLLGDAASLSEEIADDGSDIAQDSRTISAVNALVATSLEATPEMQAEDSNESHAVFVISRSSQVAGSADALSFARTSADFGETDAAYNELLELLKREPNNISALSKLAQIESGSGNYHQSAEIYSRILELDPRNASARAGLAQAVRSEDPLHYEAGLSALAQEHPNAAFIPFMLGNHFSSEQRWSEAKSAYLEAVELSGKDIPPDYHFNLAVSLERLHQPNRALEHYKNAMTVAASQGKANFDRELLASRIVKLEGSKR